MAKIKIAHLRELESLYGQGKISYSKMVEMLNVIADDNVPAKKKSLNSYSIVVSVDVETNSKVEDAMVAIKKGIRYGLDVKHIANPLYVKINYCQEQ